MRQWLRVFFSALIVSLVGVQVAAAGEASYRPVAHNNSSVCCSRNGQNWWSDYNSCYQYGGQPVGNQYCYNSGNGEGYGYGYNDPYNNPDRRVCCSSNYGIGWSTWRQCRMARGQDVMNKVCRKTRHGVDYNRIFGQGGGWGYGQDQYNNPDRRVCCKRGYYDWWSTWRECRRSGGYETANRECRND